MLLLSFWILVVCFVVSNAYNSGYGQEYQHYPGLFHGYDYQQPQFEFGLPAYGHEGFAQDFQPQDFLDQPRGLDYYPNAIDQHAHHQNHDQHQHSGGHQHNFEYFPSGFPHRPLTDYNEVPAVVEIFEEQHPINQPPSTTNLESSSEQSRNKTHGLHLARGGYGPNARVHHHHVGPFVSHAFKRTIRGLESATGGYSPNAISGVDKK